MGSAFLMPVNDIFMKFSFPPILSALVNKANCKRKVYLVRERRAI